MATQAASNHSAARLRVEVDSDSAEKSVSANRRKQKSGPDPKGRFTTLNGPYASAMPMPTARVEDACRALSAFLGALLETAEQLTPVQRWCRILSQALVKYLHGRQLNPPDLLPAPA